MRSAIRLATVFAAAITMWSCGGGSPTSPTGASTPVTISIVASAGNGAFTPNPVQAATGSTIVFKNNTRDLHHIVMDSGSVVGDVAAGASTAPMTLMGTGGNYHCTNHPSMVGSINGLTAPTPPPGSGDGY